MDCTDQKPTPEELAFALEARVENTGVASEKRSTKHIVLPTEADTMMGMQKKRVASAASKSVGARKKIKYSNDSSMTTELTNIVSNEDLSEQIEDSDRSVTWQAIPQSTAIEEQVYFGKTELSNNSPIDTRPRKNRSKRNAVKVQSAQTQTPPCNKVALYGTAKNHLLPAVFAHSIKVGVTPDGSKGGNRLISKKSAAKIRRDVLRMIAECGSNVYPKFNRFPTKHPEWIVFDCANQETADWLKQQPYWHNICYEAYEEIDLYARKYTVAGTFLLCSAVETEVIVRCMEVQNMGLFTSGWNVVRRMILGKNVRLTFEIDIDSMDWLQANNYQVAFGVGQNVHLRIANANDLVSVGRVKAANVKNYRIN